MTQDDLNAELDSLGDKCAESHRRIAGILYALSGAVLDTSDQEERFIDVLAAICLKQAEHGLKLMIGEDK